MERKNKKLEWLLASGLSEALYWETLLDGKVQCQLCPRNCTIKSGNFGFCKTRYNQGGELKTAIWGKLLMPSVEPIETEAVFHFWPGAKILSIGNLGCNLDCDFCQNWESSNMNNLQPEFVKYRTPQEIVELAKRLDIKILSFTYNDPVVWFEFVYETAKLARANGLKTLFKSAGFISSRVALKLTEVIDIFSISLKSINPETFKKMSKGILDDVLKGIKIFHKSDSHLEISNLVVPGLTDIENDIRKLARWVKAELSDEVPLHFVRFHPAYKYMHVPRTAIAFLETARTIALEEGLKYVYIGNTYQKGHADIRCRDCGSLLVNRFGLYANCDGITGDGRCRSCGKLQNIVIPSKMNGPRKITEPQVNRKSVWQWSNEDARNLHIEIHNNSNYNKCIVCDHLGETGNLLNREVFNIPGVSEVRMAVGQVIETEKEVHIMHSKEILCQVAELEDRAHFPLEKTCKI
ncbi:MAG: AmmeMemoRadiSam system radical SAM enzyme [Myxococcota bacterium]|nr:AmmeMemoRadiSam system radical SAM enzyme [Myxococcota bacterium]